MLNAVSYLKLKHIMLKYYRNARIFIEQKGIIDSRIIIDKSRILINRRKIVISNEDTDCIIEFDLLKKIKIEDKLHIELLYKDFKVILEI
ncbi:MAG: hypothetical protein IJZ36_04895 [Bacilli bacterium]|nr:hypothetical protein [Bacilli bacterium]